MPALNTLTAILFACQGQVHQIVPFQHVVAVCAFFAYNLDVLFIFQWVQAAMVYILMNGVYTVFINCTKAGGWKNVHW